ncbi:MAG: HNH endonuclease [Methanocorpusculum sp.]|nr:HNH endonuclease [Methanocorpusculum sp.]
MPVWNKITEDEKKIIVDKFCNTDLPLQDIANLVNRSYATVFRFIHRIFSKDEIKNRKRVCYSNSKKGYKNPMYGKFGSGHHNYKGGCITKSGYLMILKPSWYTSRKTQKHVFEHHVIMCEKLGLTEIPKGYMVHHCNGNKLDNCFSNLVLLTVAAHTRLHAALKRGIEGATTISKESTLKWVEAHGGGLWQPSMI